MVGGMRAQLINMHGNVVHKWQVPFSKLWSDPPHIRGRVDDEKTYFNDGHVYPNGDLVVVIEGPPNVRNSTIGYGLAKLDKDSHILWKYPANCHHSIDVGEDEIIYAISHETIDRPLPGMDYLAAPCILDYIDVLSSEGKLLKKFSILESLQDTP